MKRLCLHFLFLALALLGAGSGWAGTPEKVAIQFKWFHQFRFAGYYAAQEKGFFAEEGLEVELRAFDGKIDPVEEVLSGRADYGIFDAGLLLARLQGKPVVLVSQIFQHSPLVFVTLKESGLRTPFDLEGKRLMSFSGGTDDAPLRAMVQKALGDMTKAEWRPHTFKNQDLIDGQADAMLAYAANEPFWFLERGRMVNIIDPRDYGIDFYSDNLFTSEKEAGKNPERVEKVRRAVLKGWTYALDHPDEIVDLIQQKYNTQKKSRAHLEFEARQTAELIDRRNFPLGYFEASRFGKIGHLYQKLGMTDEHRIPPRFFGREKGVVDHQRAPAMAKAPAVRLTEEERAWIAAHPTLKVGNEIDWAPFDFAENGKPRGFAIDLLKAVGERTGLVFEFVNGPSWSELLDRFAQGELDIMPAIADTPYRRKFARFTSHYMTNPTVLVTRDSVTVLRGIHDLKGRTAALMKGYYYEETVRRDHPEVGVLAVGSFLEGLQAVLSHQADVFIGSRAVIHHTIREHLLDGLRIAGPSGIDDPERFKIKMAVAKENAVLAGILEKGLATIGSEEKIKLLKRWAPKMAEIMQSATRLEKRSARGLSVRLTQEEEAWRDGHGPVRVGVEDWPPLIFPDQAGNADGLAWDVLEAVAKKTGLTLEVVHDQWSVLLRGLREKNIDLLPATYFTEERSTYGLYTRPFFTMREFIYVKDDNPRITKIDDLARGTIAVAKDYGTIPKLRERYPEATIMETKDQMASIFAVLNGEADALLEAQIVVEQLIRKNTISGLRGIVQEVFPASPLYHFVRQDAPLLQSILQKGLDAIGDKEMRKLQSQWLALDPRSAAMGTTAEGETSAIGWLVGLSLLVLAAMAFWIRAAVLNSSEEALAAQFGSARFRASVIGGLAFLAVAILVVALLAVRHSREQNLAGLRINLQGVLKSASERLVNWSHYRQGYLEQMGRDPELAAIAGKLLATPRMPFPLIDHPAQQEARAYFKQREGEFGQVGFFIIAPDYTSLASRRDANVGTPNFIADVKPNLMKRVLRGRTAFIPPIRSDVTLREGQKRLPPTMFFAAPIKDRRDRVIAILTQRIDPAMAFSRALHLGRLGETGETYAFDREGLLLSDSRFDKELRKIGLIGEGEEALLNLSIRDPGGNLMRGYQSAVPREERPLTTMARSATRGESGVNLEGYRDYRGAPVLGAWMWSDALGIGLTTEIDADEALGPYRTTRLTVFGVLGFTLLLGFGATFFTLTLGERATRTLRRARDELEEKVEERTRKLSASEVRIRTIIENAADGIITIDPRGTVQSFSPAAERIFGYSLDEVVGKNVKMLMPEPDKSAHDGYLQRYLDTGEATIVGMNREVVGKRKDGTEFPMDLAVGEAVVDEEHIFTGIVRDITDRKLAEEAVAQSEERTRRILESVGEGVFGVDTDGIIIFVNPQCAEQLGFSEEELLGQRAHGLFHHSRPDGSDYPVALCWMFKSFTEGSSHRIDDEVLWRKDGSAFPVEYNSTPVIREGELLGAVISFNDITERKEAEARLKDALEVISGSIQYASRIQHSILPLTHNMKAALPEHVVVWEPRDVVGGDIYWCRPWGDGHLVMLGDCTGHGVPGAFMTLIANGALGQAYREAVPGDPAGLIRRMHQLIQSALGQHLPDGESDDGLELGACYIPTDRSRMTFAGARFSLFYQDEGKPFVELKGDKQGIGYRGIPQDAVFTNHEVELPEGRRFYMTSDGLLDQVGGEKRRGFGKKRFKALLDHLADRPMAEQGGAILAALAEHQGAETRRDDVSLIGFGFSHVDDERPAPDDERKRHMIQWSPGMSVGHADIDADHQKLFIMINDLSRADYSPQSGILVERILDGLIHYTHFHFQREESLMDQYGYPEAAAHKRAHAELIAVAGTFKTRFDAGSEEGLIAELDAALREWLKAHILGMDKNLGEFLRQSGQGRMNQL